jgi:hypothetical protein
METFFSALFEKITAVLDWFLSLLGMVITAMWDFVKDAFSWFFEQLLSLAVSAFQAIDVSAVSGLTSYGSIPGEVMNILGLLGLGQAISIISAAIVIRLGLQLIPFVRLGS